MRWVGHIRAVVLLTLLTQTGGVIWGLAAIWSRKMRRRVLIFVTGYAVLWGVTVIVAPLFGRVPLPCFGGAGAVVAGQSPLFCLLNRHYVTPDLKAVTLGLGAHMDRAYPGTKTRVLDGSFPFWTGFPLLPHLSHDDGRKLDLAYYYQDAGGYVPGVARSPLGYFAFEGQGAACPQAWPTLRWDLNWAQGWWRHLSLEPARQAEALRWLSADPRVEKLFIEPPLAARLGVEGPKVRFQGCRAARHDDHVHFQIAP